MATTEYLDLRPRGRRMILPPLTDHDATQMAREFIRRDSLTPQMQGLLQQLAGAGIFTEQQLTNLIGVKFRTFQKYRSAKYRLLDIVPTPLELSTFVDLLGVRGRKKEGKRLTLYTLGPVGKVLAQRYEKHPLTGYLQELEEQVAHDVLCNTVYCELAAHLGMEKIVYRNRLSATLRNSAGVAVLEPDALLEIKDSKGKKHVFVVEYHNEDTQRRARPKIERYETVIRDVNWADQWEVDEFPTILACWTHSAVATGYTDALQRLGKQRPIRGKYLGMPIRLMLEPTQNPLRWVNLATQKVETLVD